MIEIALILGAIVVGLSLFWEEFVDFVKETAREVKAAIAAVFHAVKVFVEKVNDAIQEISRHYSKLSKNQWRETTYTRTVSPNEVPSDILDKANRAAKKRAKKDRVVDVTDELEMQLAQ